jgi:serine/threonine-protein kinase
MSSEADSYQLVRCLRSTETSETYEATHPTAAGRFLVEVFASEQDARTMESFEAELATLADLGHPNVLTVVGLGKLPEGKTAAIWELPGGTLAEWLHRGRSASAEAALGVVAGVAQALAAAHGRGIAHEKIGPEHVFLIEDADLGQGGVKLGGFGLRWLAPGGAAPGTGPERPIAPDLAGLADLAERLLAPLDLPEHRPIRSRGRVQTASQVITRGRGHGAGAAFGSALEFAEALTVAVRAQVEEASTDGFEPVARPANDEQTEPMEEEEEVRPRRRIALMVARVSAATVGTVLTVLIVGVLVDPNKIPIRPERQAVQLPVAQSVPALPPAPPAAPASPVPAQQVLPAPPAAAPHSPPAALAEKPAPPPAKGSAPKVVTVGPERAREPQRARRGLVWSSRLQKLVTVEEAAREAEQPQGSTAGVSPP